MLIKLDKPTSTILAQQKSCLHAMQNTVEVSPAMPFPVPFDVQERIQQLHSYLDPHNPQYQPKQQHINIRAAIQLYQDGKIDGMEQVFLMEGKMVAKEEILTGKA